MIESMAVMAWAVHAKGPVLPRLRAAAQQVAQHAMGTPQARNCAQSISKQVVQSGFATGQPRLQSFIECAQKDAQYECDSHKPGQRGNATAQNQSNENGQSGKQGEMSQLVPGSGKKADGNGLSAQIKQVDQQQAQDQTGQPTYPVSLAA